MGSFDVWLCQFDALVTKNVATFKMRKSLVLVLVLIPLIGPLFFGWINWEVFHGWKRATPSGEDIPLGELKPCSLFDMDHTPMQGAPCVTLAYTRAVLVTRGRQVGISKV